MWAVTLRGKHESADKNIWTYLFTYGVFNDIVDSSGCIGPNRDMLNELERM
jgi:hypothetical protein